MCQVELKITQGTIGVNTAILQRDGTEIKAILIDLMAKHAVIRRRTYINAPALVLGFGADTENHATEVESGETTIEFVEYPDWRVFCAQVNGFTLGVCLICDESLV